MAVLTREMLMAPKECRYRPSKCTKPYAGFREAPEGEYRTMPGYYFLSYSQQDRLNARCIFCQVGSHVRENMPRKERNLQDLESGRTLDDYKKYLGIWVNTLAELDIDGSRVDMSEIRQQMLDFVEPVLQERNRPLRKDQSSGSVDSVAENEESPTQQNASSPGHDPASPWLSGKGGFIQGSYPQQKAPQAVMTTAAVHDGQVNKATLYSFKFRQQVTKANASTPPQNEEGTQPDGVAPQLQGAPSTATNNDSRSKSPQRETLPQTGNLETSQAVRTSNTFTSTTGGGTESQARGSLVRPGKHQQRVQDLQSNIHSPQSPGQPNSQQETEVRHTTAVNEVAATSKDVTVAFSLGETIFLSDEEQPCEETFKRMTRSSTKKKGNHPGAANQPDSTAGESDQLQGPLAGEIGTSVPSTAPARMPPAADTNRDEVYKSTREELLREIQARNERQRTVREQFFESSREDPSRSAELKRKKDIVESYRQEKRRQIDAERDTLKSQGHRRDKRRKQIRKHRARLDAEMARLDEEQTQSEATETQLDAKMAQLDTEQEQEELNGEDAGVKVLVLDADSATLARAQSALSSLFRKEQVASSSTEK